MTVVANALAEAAPFPYTGPPELEKGHFSHYKPFLGVCVPTRGDVGRFAGSTWQMVRDGELVSAEYTLSTKP
jgi:hypothetical protein